MEKNGKFLPSVGTVHSLTTIYNDDDNDDDNDDSKNDNDDDDV